MRLRCLFGGDVWFGVEKEKRRREERGSAGRGWHIFLISGANVTKYLACACTIPVQIVQLHYYSYINLLLVPRTTNRLLSNDDDE